MNRLTITFYAEGQLTIHKVHISEKVYVKQIGKLLGFSEGDIEEVISS